MTEAGLDEADSAKILADRNARYAFSVDSGAQGDDYDDEPVVEGEAA